MSVQFIDVNHDIINAIFQLEDVREVDTTLDNIVDLHGVKKAKKDKKKEEKKPKKEKKSAAKKTAKKAAKKAVRKVIVRRLD